MTESLESFRELASLDHGLCVVSMLRSDGGIAASVVNAGVMQHPVTAVDVIAFVARGLRKLDYLRADPRVTVVARAGWRWAAVEGTADILGPDDDHPDLDAEGLRVLFRDVFVAAGGTHGDWDTYDRTLMEERSAAVLVNPVRSYPSA